MTIVYGQLISSGIMKKNLCTWYYSQIMMKGKDLATFSAEEI